MKFQGVITALITPFSDGEVDFTGLRTTIRRQIDAGIDGILVLGTTAETPTLTKDERQQILDVAADEVNGEVLLMAGTGTSCTATTIENTRDAKARGADAALIVTPYYNCPTQEGIFHHFKAVSSAVELPICVYNHPGRTGTNIEAATLRRISELPTVMGIKEASGSIEQLQDVINALSTLDRDIAVMTGNDSLTLATVALGGTGVISVASNLIPEAVKALIHSAQKDDITTARALHYRLLPLYRALFMESNPIPIKAAMQEWGMPSGGCRPPLGPMQEQTHTRLCELLSNYEELKATAESPCHG